MQNICEKCLFPDESENNSSANDKNVRSCDFNNVSYSSSQATVEISITGTNQSVTSEKSLPE